MKVIEDTNYMSQEMDGSTSNIVGEMKLSPNQLVDEERKKYTSGGHVGLINIGNTCYMNSALQCLFATDLLSAYFLKKSYINDLKHSIANKIAKEYRKADNLDENEVVIVDPIIIRKLIREQIMYKLRMLFLITWNENCKLKPKTFKTSFGEKCYKMFKNKSFMGYSQEDSSEFLSLLFDILHEESKTDVLFEYKSLPQDLEQFIEISNKYEKQIENSNDKYNNKHLNGKYKEELIKKYDEYKNKNMRFNIIKKAQDTYISKVKNSHSAIIDIFTGLSMSVIQCNECKNNSHTFDLYNMINLPIPNKRNPTLYECLDEFTKNEILTGNEKYYCDKCKQKNDAIKYTGFWNMPNRLIIHFKRFNNSLRKNDTQIDFPIENLDMKKYINDPYTNDNLYDLYGVIHHSGMSINGGHYIAYVKNMVNNLWYLCNDSDILHIDTNRIENMVKSGAYILFYKKKGDVNMAKEFDEMFDI